MKESRAGQIEAKKRGKSFTALSKPERVEGAARTIEDAMYKIRHREGEVVFPHSLSEPDEEEVRELVRRRHGNLAFRIDVFIPIRLEEGMGTLIWIKKKGGRR